MDSTRPALPNRSSSPANRSSSTERTTGAPSGLRGGFFGRTSWQVSQQEEPEPRASASNSANMRQPACPSSPGMGNSVRYLSLGLTLQRLQAWKTATTNFLNQNSISLTVLPIAQAHNQAIQDLFNQHNPFTINYRLGEVKADQATLYKIFQSSIEKQKSPVLIALEQDQLDCLRELLAAEPSWLNEKFNDLVNHAVMHGAIDCLVFMLEHKDIDTKNPDSAVSKLKGINAKLINILLALLVIKNDQADSIKELFGENGVDPKWTDKQGNTLVHHAVKLSAVRCLFFLLFEKNARSDKTNNAGIAPALVANGLREDSVAKKEIKHYLQLAKDVEKGHITKKFAIMRLRHLQALSENQRNNSKCFKDYQVWSDEQRLSSANQICVLFEQALEQNIDPAILAIKTLQTTCLVELIASGIDLKKAYDAAGNTLLHIAVEEINNCTENSEKRKAVACLDVLLNEGQAIDPNIKNKAGSEPLHLAAESGNFLALFKLLEHSQINLKLKNSSKLIAAKLAAKNRHAACLEKLIEKGANFFNKVFDTDGYSREDFYDFLSKASQAEPITIQAIEKNKPYFLLILLKCGVDPYAKNTKRAHSSYSCGTARKKGESN